MLQQAPTRLGSFSWFELRARPPDEPRRTRDMNPSRPSPFKDPTSSEAASPGNHPLGLLPQHEVKAFSFSVSSNLFPATAWSSRFPHHGHRLSTERPQGNEKSAPCLKSACPQQRGTLSRTCLRGSVSAFSLDQAL